MRKEPVLGRKLVLETRTDTPDGRGGFATSWSAVGTLWAEVTARSGRQALVGGRITQRVAYRVVVRGAPVGSPSRPRPDQRFREGSRIFTIIAVSENDPEGRYLECWTEEGQQP